MARKCFIIGPMGEQPDEAGLHSLQRLARNIIMPLLTELQLSYQVITPWELPPGDIMTGVISAIDRADFVIADLTGLNPNVMYELAICHSLGKHVITVGADKPPFDIYGITHIYLARDTMPDAKLRAQLIAAITYVHEQLLEGDLPENPVTKYYGAPLTGVNETVAVAHTYFHNFVRPTIEQMMVMNNENTEYLNEIGIITRDEEHRLTIVNRGRRKADRANLKLLVVVPNKLEYVTLNYINELRGPESEKLKAGFLSTPHRFFVILARVIDDEFRFVDIPTPMNGIVRTIERRARNLQIDRGKREWAELEAEEIDRFYNTLERLIRNHRDILRGRVELLRFDTSLLEISRPQAAEREPRLLWLYDLWVNNY
jgi:hypothetical protein